jgi:hypothetical protein
MFACDVYECLLLALPPLVVADFAVYADTKVVDLLPSLP